MQVSIIAFTLCFINYIKGIYDLNISFSKDLTMKELLFGSAGIPIATNPRETLNGINTVKKLGLNAMELEFVQSVNISKEKAPLVKEAAAKNDVVLTCHGQYCINLNSLEEAKIIASRKRILNNSRRAYESGAWSICFHMAFYLKQDPVKVYDKVKAELKLLSKQLQDEGNKIWLRAETTGKNTQFGNLKETLRLSQEIDGVMPCIDFAHLHARDNGKWNTSEEFSSILTDVEKHLGKEGLENMHIHIAGIEYSEKGERRHLELKKSDMNYKDLVKAWKDFKIKGVVVSESPNIEKDALLLKSLY